MAKRYSVIVTILLILAAVFYVSLRFFSSGQVISRTQDGLVVSSEALQVKIVALVGFMTVSIIGLYICMSLLTNPKFEKEERRDEGRPSLWSTYLHELRFPAFETDEDEEE